MAAEEAEQEDISIHAPTRGATFSVIMLAIVTCISIHAPTRGATIVPVKIGGFEIISIHAPTRGATGTGWTIISWSRRNFNPRSHERSDADEFGFDFNDKISIHAPTRGATNPVSNTAINVMYFNPRSHERSDVSYLLVMC